MIEIKSLDEVKNRGKPFIVDFYADWCGPCKTLAPTLEALSGETGVEVVKVNVDTSPELAAEFGVRSIPTMVFFGLDGQPKEQLTGASSKEKLLPKFQALLA